MANNILLNGYPSLEEIKSANTWPDEARFAKGPVAIIECVQEIPCNPCENACPSHAIHVGEPITTTPSLSLDKCTGCGLCVAACSGLAIFVVDKSYSDKNATVSFPFEFYPLPAKGDTVDALDRTGSYICKGVVTRVVNTVRNDHTPVITIEIPKEHADTVRTIRRLGSPAVPPTFTAIEAVSSIDDDIIVCRCEEITAGEVRKAIRSYAGESVTDIKRRVRCGMGLCQGKTCGRLVTRLISEETGKQASVLLPSTDRPPVRPVTFGALADGIKGGNDND